MILEPLVHELDQRNLALDDFRLVVHRLLDKQVIYRAESHIEAEIYDLYVRMDDLVTEYLQTIGITVIINKTTHFIIAYPPGSNVPGVHTEKTDTHALQRRIRGDEAGLLITLRLLYEEKLREGEIDENGCVFVPLETIFTRYHSILKREMPAVESDRKAIFSTLRQLRVIEYGDVSDADQWIGIREVVLNFTLQGVIDALDAVTGGTDHPVENGLKTENGHKKV